MGSNYLLPNCDEAVFLIINLVLPLTQLVRELKTWLLSSSSERFVFKGEEKTDDPSWKIRGRERGGGRVLRGGWKGGRGQPWIEGPALPSSSDLT